MNIKDVAKKAGVSITTVSRVLNNRGYISKETRVSVEKAMAELDYRPNQIARALLKNQSYILGVIVPDISHPFFSELIRYLELYASEQNYKILICSSLGEAEKEANYLDMLRENRVDGIIICSHTLEIEEYTKVNLPIISFDRIIAPNIPYAGSDNFKGGELAAAHLIERGCKRLLHISGPLEFDLLPNRRADAFRVTCLKHEVPFKIVEGPPHKMTFDQMYSFIEAELVGELSACDGIFCSNDTLAYAVYAGAANNGIKVPEQLKIVGYDYHSFTRMLQSPRITTIKQPIERIGKSLCSTIINMIENKNGETPANLILDVELIKGDTT
ncbi:LacI family DNA-binding transcriptional regulator [Paenibacillaceae bacterium WGS1546]|uniref:LacI family DNA-binding transcriptional regulator n=1 Tax=Cohnella sp. WGS1546 TaxID=3366810 RepID=UPI00372CF775